MKNYEVYGYNAYGDPTYHERFSEPKAAIKAWFVQNHKTPMETNLMAKTKEDAIALIEWAADNKDFLAEMDELHKSHYKLPYLLQYVEDQKKDQCKYFYAGKSGEDWDSVFPFCMG